ncbi:MAG TPA: single-stranded DNA-binding protein [Ferruginibacter sp.]|nr:single-stranded DNA-binding protein [Ferruginibacter sp.]HMP22121.1 single-stranded DNA-binding protein [Ferruginibacter sp.]
MIKLQIVGHLGKDCTVKEINGKNVINFSVAHSEKYKDSQGNPKERTIWVECAYWTDRTAVAQYLSKGKLVYAEGSPEADAYLNKENQPAATLRMRVQNVQLLGGNAVGDHAGSAAAPSYASATNNNATAAPLAAMSSAPVVDDLPF